MKTQVQLNENSSATKLIKKTLNKTMETIFYS